MRMTIFLRAVVIVALSANLLIAVAKTVASVITGSPSMLAEAAHSWADTGNEVFLLITPRFGAGCNATHRPTEQWRQSSTLPGGELSWRFQGCSGLEA